MKQISIKHTNNLTKLWSANGGLLEDQWQNFPRSYHAEVNGPHPTLHPLTVMRGVRFFKYWHCMPSRYYAEVFRATSHVVA